MLRRTEYLAAVGKRTPIPRSSTIQLGVHPPYIQSHTEKPSDSAATSLNAMMNSGNCNNGLLSRYLLPSDVCKVCDNCRYLSTALKILFVLKKYFNSLQCSRSDWANCDDTTSLNKLRKIWISAVFCDQTPVNSTDVSSYLHNNQRRRVKPSKKPARISRTAVLPKHRWNYTGLHGIT
jgi:hypothetical protein